MNVKIEANDQGSGCKVWLDGSAVSFQSLGEAQAYVEQLQGRLDAASDSFALRHAEPEKT